MVQGSNPSGSEIVRTHPQQPWNPPSLLYSGHQVIPRVQGPGHGVNPLSLIAPGLNKE